MLIVTPIALNSYCSYRILPTSVVKLALLIVMSFLQKHPKSVLLLSIINKEIVFFVARRFDPEEIKFPLLNLQLNRTTYKSKGSMPSE